MEILKDHGMNYVRLRIFDNPDSLAELIYAGIWAVKVIAPATAVMIHIALGGQTDVSKFFLDNIINRGVPFDVIGLSYYPRWHNTLGDLPYNLDDLSHRYKKDVIVVEYSHLNKEVNELAFKVADSLGKGSCIWEPLSTWENFSDSKDKANELLLTYDEVSKQYLNK